MNEYTEFIPKIHKVRNILCSYDVEQIQSIKQKVISEFGKFKGDFKTKFNNLADKLSGNHTSDDEYVLYVRAICIYCFEICLIGKRVSQENDHS